MTYNSKLVFKTMAPEPGSARAVPAETLVEPKHAAVRMADRALGGPVRGSQFNSGWRWHLQLWAGIFAIIEGVSILAIVAGLFGRLL